MMILERLLMIALSGSEGGRAVGMYGAWVVDLRYLKENLGAGCMTLEGPLPVL